MTSRRTTVTRAKDHVWFILKVFVLILGSILVMSVPLTLLFHYLWHYG